MATSRRYHHSAQGALQCCLESKFCATSVEEAVIPAVIEKAGPTSVSGECGKGSPCGLGSFLYHLLKVCQLHTVPNPEP